MNTIEGNLLIAEFMGIRKDIDCWQVNEQRFIPSYYPKDRRFGFLVPKDLKFHSSWDWQINAWAKCSRQFNIIIARTNNHKDNNSIREEILWLRSEYTKAVHNGNVDHGFNFLINAINFYNEIFEQHPEWCNSEQSVKESDTTKYKKNNYVNSWFVY